MYRTGPNRTELEAGHTSRIDVSVPKIWPVQERNPFDMFADSVTSGWSDRTERTKRYIYKSIPLTCYQTCMCRSRRPWNMPRTIMFLKTAHLKAFRPMPSLPVYHISSNSATSGLSHRTESTKRHNYTLRPFIWNQNQMSRALRFEDMTCTSLFLLKKSVLGHFGQFDQFWLIKSHHKYRKAHQ